MKLLLLFFVPFFFGAQAQSNLVRDFNLMPWPKNIVKNTFKVKIDDGFSVSLNRVFPKNP